MLGSRKNIFAGKQRIYEEPFCPFVTNDTGYSELFRKRSSSSAYSPLQNTGSFGPVTDMRHGPARPWRR